MIPFLRAKELFEIFNQHLDAGKSWTDKELNRSFVPHLWKNDVVSTQSFLGKVFQLISIRKSPPEQALRVHKVFSEVLKTLSQASERQAVPEAQLLRLHKFIKVDTWAPGVVQKQTAMLTGLPEMREISKKKKLDQETAMRSGSLLHSQEKSGRKIDVKLFSQIFSTHSDQIIEPVKQAFFDHLKRYPEYVDTHIQENMQRIEKGLEKHKQLQSTLLPNGQKLSPKQYQALSKEMAEEMAAEIRACPKGQPFFYCGKYGKIGSCLAMFTAALQQISPEILEDCPEIIKVYLELGKLPSPKDYQNSFLEKMDEVQKTFPELQAILGSKPISRLLSDPSRRLPKNLAKVLPDCIAKCLESWQQQGIIGNLMEFVQDGGLREFMLATAAFAKNLDDPGQAKVFYERMTQRLFTYSSEQLEFFQTEIESILDQQAEKMLVGLQSILPKPLKYMLGLDTVGMRGQFWLEYTHEKDGTYTVSIHATGPALALHRKSGGKLEWPLRISGVQADRLNTDFFQYLLFHQFAAEYSPTAIISIEALYQGMLEHLGGNRDEQPKTLRVLDSTLSSPWEMMQVFCIKQDVALDRVNFSWHKECLIDFCQLRIREGKLVLSSEQECRVVEQALGVVFAEMSRLEGVLDSSEIEQVKKTCQEIQSALEAARHEGFSNTWSLTGAGISIPPDVAQAVQKFFRNLGLTQDRLQSVRDILAWCFGDEVGELVDALLPSDLLTSTLQTTDTGSSSTKTVSTSIKKSLISTQPKGWLRTILFHTYTGVMIQAFQYMVLFSRSYSCGLLFVSKSVVGKVGRYLVPQAIQDWYALVMAALQRKMLDLVVQIVLRLMMRFSKKETDSLLAVFQQWKESAQTYAKIALGKEEISFFLDKPIVAPAKTQESVKKYSLPAASFQISKWGELRHSEFIGKASTVFSKEVSEGPLSHMNVENMIRIWNKGWEKDSNLELQEIQQKIFRLPVPKLGVKDLWDEIPEEQIASCADALLDLTCRLQNCTNTYNRQNNPLLYGESVVLSYSLLAVMDKLAKRDPTAHLFGFSVNAYPFLHWFQSTTSELANPLYLQKLRDVCGYFFPKIDLDALPTTQELEKMARSTLFDYSSFTTDVGGLLSAYTQYEIPELKYLRKLLAEEPTVQRNLEEIAVSEDFIGDQRLRILFKESIYFRAQPILSPVYQMLRWQTIGCKTFAEGHDNDRIYLYRKRDRVKKYKKPRLNWLQRYWEELVPVDVSLPKDITPAAKKKKIPDEMGWATSRMSWVKEVFTNQHTQSKLLSRLARKTMSVVWKKNEFYVKISQVEPTDTLMRILGHWRTHPEIVLEENWVVTLEWAFFQAGRLSQQLKASPEVAEEVGNIFSEAIAYLDARGDDEALQKLLLIGIQVKKYCSHCVAPEKLQTFPDFTACIFERMHRPQKDDWLLTCYRQLYALSMEDETRPMDAPSKKEVIRAIFLAISSSCSSKTHDFSYIENAFKLMYRRWLPEILEMTKELSFVKTCFIDILRQLKYFIPQEKESLSIKTEYNVLGYKKDFSSYLGLKWDWKPFSFNLRDGMVWLDDKDAAVQIRTIQQYLQEQGESQQRFRYVSYREWVSENGEVRVLLQKPQESSPVVKMDERAPHSGTLDPKQDVPRFEVHKKIEGSWYIQVDVASFLKDKEGILPLTTGWLSTPAQDGTREMRLYFQGKYVQSFRVQGELETGYELEEIREAPQMVRIDPLHLPSSFRMLTKFCPLSQIECYGALGQSCIQQLNFSSYDLSFTVKSDVALGEDVPFFRAENNDLFPGYAIAKRQTCQELKGISSYLLLENAHGQKKILMPAGQWVPQFVGSFLSRLGIFANLVPTSLFDALMSSTKKKYYVFDVEEGELQTHDHEASAYLLNLYLLAGEREKAECAFKAWNVLSKQLPMGKLPKEQMWALVLVTLVFPWAKSIRQKILAVWEENRLVQVESQKVSTSQKVGQKETDSTLLQENLFWGIITYMDLLEVQRETDPACKLTDDQEWFLLQRYLHHSRGLWARAVPEYAQNELGDLEDIGIVSLPEAMRERYQILSKKYGCPVSGIVSAGLGLKSFIETESSVPAMSEKLGMIRPGTLLGTTLLKREEVSLSTAIQAGWRVWKEGTAQRKDSVLFQAMLPELDQEAPLTYETLTPENLKKYFLSYYAMALKEPEILSKTKKKEGISGVQESSHRDVAPKKRLEQLHEKLRDTLWLLKNGSAQTWWESDRTYLEYLLTICWNPTLFEESAVLLKAKRQPTGGDALCLDFKIKQPLFVKFFDKIQARVRTIRMGKPLSLLCKEASKNILDLSIRPGRMVTSYWSTAYYASKFFNFLVAKPKTQELPSGKTVDFRMESLAILGQEDKEFDQMFDGLFAMALEVDATSAQEHAPPTTEKLDGEDQTDEWIQQNLTAYSDRPGRLPEYLRLKNPKILWGLYLDLVKVRDQVKIELETGKNGLLAVVNEGQKNHTVTFEEMTNFFLTGEIDKTHLSHLSPEQLQKLDGLIGQFLVKDTRFKQIQRAIEQLEAIFRLDPKGDRSAYEQGIEQIAATLRTKRTYSFASLPSRLARTLLLFEHGSDTLLWEKQSSRIIDLLLGDRADVVFELIMSLGKTSTMIPIISQYIANGKNLVFNIWPKAIAETNISQISKQNRKIFHQTMNALRFSRDMAFTAHNLQSIYVLFRRAIEQRETINMTREDAQALELLLIDCLHKCESRNTKGVSQIEELVKGVSKLLLLIRTRAKFMGDEAHELLSGKQELNYPIGPSKTIGTTVFDTIDVCMQAFSRDKELRTLIRKDQLHYLSTETYARVQGRLALEMSHYGRFEVSDAQRKEFIAYVSGKAKKIPKWIEESTYFSEIAMVKGVLSILLPMILQRACAVDYGAQLEDRQEFALPFEGNSSPVEKATIRNPHEALVKTYIMYFLQGLQKKQSRQLLYRLREQAEKEMVSFGVPLQETAAYGQLLSWFPLKSDADLVAIFQGKSLEDTHKVLKALQKHPDAVRTYIKEFVWRQITYWKKNARNNAHNFASMAKSQYFDTGTPYNYGEYPAHLKVLWDPGTIGEALHILSKKCPKDGVQLLTKNQPDEVVEEVLEKYFQKDSGFTAIIDGGAQFRGLDTLTVARCMMDFVSKKRPDIEAIDFFAKDEQGRDQLVSLMRGATKPIPHALCKVALTKRLSYFDQRHGFGANIHQKFNGKGLVLVGEQHYLYRLLQEVFRMRGVKIFKKLLSQTAITPKELQEEDLSQTQTIHFAITPRVHKKISPKRAPVTLRDVVKFAIKNEMELVTTQNYQAYRAKIFNIIRRAVLDKILHASTVREKRAIFRAFQNTDLLISRVEDDPKKLYGLIDRFVNTGDVLKSLQTEALKLVEKQICFTEEERLRLQKEMEAIDKPVMPEQVRIFEGENGMETGVLEDLDKEVSVQTDQDTSTEQEQEQGTDQEMDTQSQGQLPLTTFTETPWDTTLNPASKAWLTFTSPIVQTGSFLGYGLNRFLTVTRFVKSALTPPLLRLVDVLETSGDELFRNSSKVFDSRIWMTNNFLPRILPRSSETPVELGSDQQRNLFQVLIHVTEEAGKLKITSVGCLSQADAAAWRKILHKSPKTDKDGPGSSKVILYDTQVKTQVFTSGVDINLLKASSDWQLLEAQLKFLNGDVHYIAEQRPLLRDWIRASGVSKMRELFYAIHHQRGDSPLSYSVIDKIFKELHGLP